MSGPAVFDIYSNCMDISALEVTTARDVVVPGEYDVMSVVYRCLCCRIDCAKTYCTGRVWFASDFRFSFEELLPGVDKVEIVLHCKFKNNFPIFVFPSPDACTLIQLVQQGRLKKGASSCPHKAGGTPLLCVPKLLIPVTRHKVWNVGVD
jgi:hypothetical protein